MIGVLLAKLAASIQGHDKFPDTAIGIFASALLASIASIFTFIFSYTSTIRGLYHLCSGVIWSGFAFDASDLFTLSNLITAIFWCAFVVDLHTPFTHHTRQLPFTDFSFFQGLSFSWLEQIISLAGRKTLEGPDIWEVDEGTSVQRSLHHLLTTFKGGWHRVTFASFLIKGYTAPLSISATLELLSTLGKLAQPWLLKEFLRQPSLTIVGYMFYARILTALCSSHGLLILKMVSIRVKSSLTSLIYERIFSTKAIPAELTPANLTEVDANRIQTAIPNIHAIWSLPAQALISLSCITRLIGFRAVLLACFVLVRNLR